LDTGFTRTHFKLKQLNEKQPGNAGYSQLTEAGIAKRIIIPLAVAAPEPSRIHEVKFLSPAAGTGISCQFFFLLE
jgi:hypothetical protein